MSWGVAGRRRAVAVAAGAAVALLSAVGAAAAPGHPSRFGSGKVAFTTYTAPALRSADAAGEPSLGIDWRNDVSLYQAYTDTYRVTFDDTKNPPVATWRVVTAPSSIVNLDPILATDPATGFTLAGGDTGSCSAMAATTDDGSTWTPSLPCTVVIDHPGVGIGPAVAGDPLVRGETGTAAYFCQQYPLADTCARSLDGGLTWLDAVPVPGCFGLTGHPRVADDGTAYVPVRTCSQSAGALPSGVGGGVTTDNGATWRSFRASAETSQNDPSIAITPDGTVYEAYNSARTFQMLVMSSRDRAATWSAAEPVAPDIKPAFTGTAFPAAVAGDNKQVAVAYLGTQDLPPPGKTPYDAGFTGSWYLYVSISRDGGHSWSTVRATKAPVQRGPICLKGISCTGGRNLLDFIDAGVTRTGRIEIAIADGCHGAICSGPAPPANGSQWATIVRQSAGRGLFQHSRG